MPLQQTDLWTVDQKELSSGDFQMFLLELKLDDLRRMLDNGSDPSALSRTVLPEYTFEQEETKTE